MRPRAGRIMLRMCCSLCIDHQEGSCHAKTSGQVRARGNAYTLSNVISASPSQQMIARQTPCAREGSPGGPNQPRCHWKSSACMRQHENFEKVASGEAVMAACGDKPCTDVMSHCDLLCGSSRAAGRATEAREHARTSFKQSAWPQHRHVQPIEGKVELGYAQLQCCWPSTQRHADCHASRYLLYHQAGIIQSHEHGQPIP